MPKTQTEKLNGTLLSTDKKRKFMRGNLGTLLLVGIVTGMFAMGLAVFLWLLVYNIFYQLDGYLKSISMILVVMIALFLFVVAPGGFAAAIYADRTYQKIKRLVYCGKLTSGIWVRSERFSNSKQYGFVFKDDLGSVV